MMLPSRSKSAGAPETQELRKCPECAELILREAKKCKHCGSVVEPVAPVKEASVTTMWQGLRRALGGESTARNLAPKRLRRHDAERQRARAAPGEVQERPVLRDEQIGVRASAPPGTSGRRGRGSAAIRALRLGSVVDAVRQARH